MNYIHETIFERKKNTMSFNHVNLNKDFVIIGSDSREVYASKEINDNRQKTFINRELKLCWSFTGLTTFHDLDNIEVIKNIMNLNDSHIVEKLTLIEAIMCFQTKRYYQEYQKDIYFVFFICCNDNEGNVIYTLEIKNGVSNIEKKRKHYTDFYISSGVHLEVEKQIQLHAITDINLAPYELNRIIHLAMKESSKDDNTIGGHAYIALMDDNGQIYTYIDGIETDF